MNARELMQVIDNLKVDASEFTVLSSGGLTIRGILKEAHDLDIAVTKKGLEQLKENYDIKPKEGNPGWYVVNDIIEACDDAMEGKKERYGRIYIQDINDYHTYLENSVREKDKLRIPLVDAYIQKRKLVEKYAVLETDRLILRKSRLEDLDDIYNNVWSDPVLAENMLWRPHTDIESALDRLYRNIAWQKDNFTYFICLKETGEVIGFAGIDEVEPHLFYDYGLCLAQKYQGMGLAREFMEAFKTLVFEELDGEKFIYTCFSHNTKSSTLCKRCGFKYLESEPRVREYDGMNYILDKYYMDKEMYKNNENIKKK